MQAEILERIFPRNKEPNLRPFRSHMACAEFVLYQNTRSYLHAPCPIILITSVPGVEC